MMGDVVWPNRLFALDASRGFSSLVVVLWHWQHFAYQGDNVVRNFNKSTQPLFSIFKIFYENGHLGVHYFFLLSGFIFFWLYRTSIKNKVTSFSDFWVQRFSRLYPLHFITLLIVALLQAIYISLNGKAFVYVNNDLYHFFLNLCFASKWGFESGWSFNGPAWSISIEILLYFVFFLIAILGQGRAIFCLSISIIFFSFSITLFTHNAIMIALSLFFYGGFVFHSTFLLSTKLQKLKNVIFALTILSWFLTICNVYFIDLHGLIMRYGVGGEIFLIGFPVYILFPLTICSLVLIEINKGDFLKPISWIGNITYSSYLLHFPLQLVFVLGVSFGILNFDFYFNSSYLLVFFVLLISLSYITFIGFERPVQNFIRNKYKRHCKSYKQITTSNN